MGAKTLGWVDGLKMDPRPTPNQPTVYTTYIAPYGVQSVTN